MRSDNENKEKAEEENLRGTDTQNLDTLPFINLKPLNLQVFLQVSNRVVFFCFNRHPSNRKVHFVKEWLFLDSIQLVALQWSWSRCQFASVGW
jgi:hypothetical protein